VKIIKRINNFPSSGWIFCLKYRIDLFISFLRIGILFNRALSILLLSIHTPQIYRLLNPTPQHTHPTDIYTSQSYSSAYTSHRYIDFSILLLSIHTPQIYRLLNPTPQHTHPTDIYTSQSYSSAYTTHRYIDFSILLLSIHTPQIYILLNPTPQHTHPTDI